MGRYSVNKKGRRRHTNAVRELAEARQSSWNEALTNQDNPEERDHFLGQAAVMATEMMGLASRIDKDGRSQRSACYDFAAQAALSRQLTLEA